MRGDVYGFYPSSKSGDVLTDPLRRQECVFHLFAVGIFVREDRSGGSRTIGGSLVRAVKEMRPTDRRTGFRAQPQFRTELDSSRIIGTASLGGEGRNLSVGILGIDPDEWRASELLKHDVSILFQRDASR